MLDTTIIKKINDFVYIKPRTIQDIAHLIGKNWRTADSYVQRISSETGSISTVTFREGTRGALKIVFWNNIEKIHSSEFQERLFKQIELGRKKSDFSPFDIYQYVDDKKRSAFLKERKNPAESFDKDLMLFLRQAEKQVLNFSGNISWINLVEKNNKIIKIVEELAEKNISFKVLTRIDIGGVENIKKIMAINSRLGKELIEVRHSTQPLRGFIIDNKVARFREEKKPADYREGELKKEMMLFYEIYDEEWIEWLQKIFWNLFRTAIPAKKRLKDLESIKNL